MTRITRFVLSALLLVGLGLLAGCGDSGGGGSDAAGAPQDATVEEFCQPFVDMIKDVTAKGEDISDEDALKIAKSTADKLEEVGTPKDMSADARKGFELVVKKLQDLPDDATKEDIDQFTQLSDEEQKYSDALTEYITKNCAQQMLDLGAGAG